MADAAKVGMGEDEFWFSTPAYFAARQEAYTEDYRNGWEQSRFIAYVMAKTVDPKKKIKSPQSFWPFPWDAPSKKFAPLTEEQRSEMRKFDEEADLIMQKYQPEAWAKILEARAVEARKKAEQQLYGN